MRDQWVVVEGPDPAAIGWRVKARQPVPEEWEVTAWHVSQLLWWGRM